MNTNWADVAVCAIYGATLVGGLAVAAWLADKGHDGLALLAIVIVGCLRFKTGV